MRTIEGKCGLAHAVSWVFCQRMLVECCLLRIPFVLFNVICRDQVCWSNGDPVLSAWSFRVRELEGHASTANRQSLLVGGECSL